MPLWPELPPAHVSRSAIRALSGDGIFCGLSLPEICDACSEIAEAGDDSRRDRTEIEIASRSRRDCAEIAPRSRLAPSAGEKVGELTADQADKLRAFKPSCSINDRAANARKASRLVCGLEVDDPTCSQHAMVNILEEGRKAIDGIVRRLMGITDEQAEADAQKVKALRTVVGWNNSPACALIFMLQKYVAICSSKGCANSPIHNTLCPTHPNSGCTLLIENWVVVLRHIKRLAVESDSA